MNLLIAPDSFKGCLSSEKVCDAMLQGAKAVDENINVMQFPSSDGGEGFCYCMKNVFGGEYVEREVTFPLGNKGKTSFIFNSKTSTAFIELASCSGLSLIEPQNRNIMISSTYGVGELICEAVKLGAETIFVGLGGSATNDCGMGLLSALGAVFKDENENILKPIPYNLDKVATFDKSKMIDLSKIKIIAACDVKNPLCGKNGAAEIFSRQKGATEREVIMLDKAALSFAKALKCDYEKAGCGAAGGVGFALISVLDAEYISGASLLVNSKSFETALKSADYVLTGEGNTDKQTAFGKLISVIAKKSNKMNVPTIVISGGLSEGYEELFSQGVKNCYALSKSKDDLEYCIKNAFELLKEKTFDVVKELYK